MGKKHVEGDVESADSSGGQLQDPRATRVLSSASWCVMLLI